jgi:hypothetical protein
MFGQENAQVVVGWKPRHIQSAFSCYVHSFLMNGISEITNCGIPVDLFAIEGSLYKYV